MLARDSSVCRSQSLNWATTSRYRLGTELLATPGKIITRFPGLASAIHAQVTRLINTGLPAGGSAIATERQLDELLGSVVERVVAGAGRLRGDPRTELDELVGVTGSTRREQRRVREELRTASPVDGLAERCYRLRRGRRGGCGRLAARVFVSPIPF
jgi:hypothetical protein